jgi:predicted Fe-S protein YdhL (DUF1289 family)
MPSYKVVGIDSDGTTLGITLQEVVPEGQVGDGFRVTIPVADWNAMTAEQQQEWLKARVQERIRLLEQVKLLEQKAQEESTKYDSLKGMEVAV